jgi:hypothetical protein
MKRSGGVHDMRSAFFVFLLLVVCATHSHIIAADSIDTKDLLGAWVLETVGGQPPGVFAIRSWRINFSPDQRWTYAGEMTGRFAGMQLRGSGEWRLNSTLLEYSAGANKGQSKVIIRDGSLTLTPDPVVMPEGKTRVVTTYQRAGT